MKHLYVTDTGNDPDELEAGRIHYEGCGLIGSETLCGHTDRTSWKWAYTTKRVNCCGCIAVRNHVIGRDA